jgi:hypothetical protein
LGTCPLLRNASAKTWTQWILEYSLFEKSKE